MLSLSLSSLVTMRPLILLPVSVTVNVGEDCPVFDGMYEFCQLSAGGSIGKWGKQELLGVWVIYWG